MNRWLAVAFGVSFSSTIAAAWATVQWLWDTVAGTTLIPSNDAVMWLLVTATGGGLLAAVLFDQYVGRFPGREVVSASNDRLAETDDGPSEDESGGAVLEERIPISISSLSADSPGSPKNTLQTVVDSSDRHTDAVYERYSKDETHILRIDDHHLERRSKRDESNMYAV